MSVLNSNLLSAAWLEGSNNFQQRIPNPSISDYSATVAALFEPMNNDLFNEFSQLLNGIIGTYVHSKQFNNPLAVLKKPMTGRYQFGNTERHIAIKYLQAHTRRWDDKSLLQVNRPEFVEWFYSKNHQRTYDFTWSKIDLQEAFASDGYGFEDLLIGTFAALYSSDNVDEMYAMIQCFAEADVRLPNGIFKANLTAAPTDESTAKELLTKIRSFGGKMKFPSMNYNNIEVPTFETPETLVLWVVPEVLAVLDVQALSGVFQLDRANIQYRIVEIPEFPLPNVYAALTSEDFIYARDFYYNMEPPFYNPAARTLKYYFHHDQLIGVNPAANAILFTTEEGTELPTTELTVTGIEFDPDELEVYAGGEFQTSLALTGTGASGPITLQPNAALYSLSCLRTIEPESEEEDPTYVAVDLNSRTYVDERGILHVQKSGLEVGDVITITATAVYVNPSGDTGTYTDTCACEVIATPANPAK